MKNLFFAFLVLTAIGFYSCQKEPAASFTASKATATVGESISFTNTSIDGVSFEWGFGDGGTSTEENPSHTFSTAGTFSVKLTVYSKKEKKSDDASVSITINELAPGANFTFTGAGGNAPCTVTFTNTSTNSTSYSWDFGDGETSTAASPQHTYVTGGTFTVQLAATGDGGTNSNSKTVNILNPVGPVANFTYSGAGGYAPCTVTFTNTSQNATTYSWDFGDGGTSTTTNPTHTFNSGGVYTVTLTATGTGGSNSISKTINVLATPTKVNIVSVSVTAMPLVDSVGGSWDVLDGADLYFEFYDSDYNSLLSSYSSITWNVANFPVIWSYTGSLPQISALSQDYEIDLFDEDTTYDWGSYNEFISWVTVNFSSYTSYPSTITLTDGYGTTIVLSVTWE